MLEIFSGIWATWSNKNAFKTKLRYCQIRCLAVNFLLWQQQSNCLHWTHLRGLWLEIFRLRSMLASYLSNDWRSSETTVYFPSFKWVLWNKCLVFDVVGGNLTSWRTDCLFSLTHSVVNQRVFVWFNPSSTFDSHLCEWFAFKAMGRATSGPIRKQL